MYMHCQRNSQYVFVYWGKYTPWTEYSEKCNKQFCRRKQEVKIMQSSFNVITLSDYVSVITLLTVCTLNVCIE